MMMKCTAVCLVALTLLGSLCDAQLPSKPQYWRPPVRQKPKQLPQVPQQLPQVPQQLPQVPQQPPQVPQQPPQVQQSKQTFETPLTWKYPLDPVPERQPEVPFELRYPVPAATVAVECRETLAHVEVKRDLFGIGQLINTADLTLGTCGAAAEDTNAQVLIFEAELQACESSLMMTEDSLIYTFVLNYNPQPLGGAPVVRTSKAAIYVDCYYPRKQNVSSLPLLPLWIPFSAVTVAEEFLYFTLKLMTDDWQYERPSYQYLLGDIINFEATVMQYFHVPLRVYVNSCVATLSPNVSSNPRYAFIENNGCLVDAIITGSDSKFMPRTAENKLQFQLEAFRFKGADSGLLYVTCHLTATSTAFAIDSEHKACSYMTGWKEASGTNAVCDSCGSGIGTGSSTDLSTPGRKVRDLSQTEVFEWEGDVTLGPIPIGERVAT